MITDRSGARPRVSVIIPAYQPGPMLRRSLGSVIAQTVTDWECVVLDDGSTESLDWVSGLDPRVRLHRQLNAGVSVARNRAVALTSAPLVAFLDQDDEWLPDKLERQLASRTAETVLSCTGFEWHFASGDVAPADLDRAAPTLLSMLADDHICLSSIMVDRDALVSVGGFSPVVSQNQDWLLFLHLLRLYPGAGQCDYVAAPLVQVNLHDANASRNYVAAYRERKRILAAFADESDDPAVIAACERGQRRNRELRAYQAIDAARDRRRAGGWPDAVPDLARAAQLNAPVLARSIAAAFKS